MSEPLLIVLVICVTLLGMGMIATLLVIRLFDAMLNTDREDDEWKKPKK